ncbi:MAG: ACP S-malonyltransferase [Bacteroides sp.]|nr:ACP S-malonyltransferase [Roseburia sp.]MCM1462894.1 ACP S-malonyltransferase [Bacteroides sp.]
MTKTVLLFSGQGSQYPGMGEGLVSGDPAAYEPIFKTGSEILGFDLKKTMFNAPAEELSRTEISQPAIFTMSLLCAEKYRREGGDFGAVAGHSLGEYAAMVVSGMVDLATGYTLIKKRAACMEKAAKKNGGKMAAVLTPNTELVEMACTGLRLTGSYVTPVNYNSTQQTVIAGSADGVDKATALLLEKGVKRVVPLAVAAAFHSDFMKEASVEFYEAIRDTVFAAPTVKFYSNVLGGELTDFSDLPTLLARHICSPVRFTDELRAMEKDGFTSFVECGPGKTLVGFVKKTLDGVETTAMDA